VPSSENNYAWAQNDKSATATGPVIIVVIWRQPVRVDGNVRKFRRRRRRNPEISIGYLDETYLSQQQQKEEKSNGIGQSYVSSTFLLHTYAQHTDTHHEK
jgi:hypothetical protein